MFLFVCPKRNPKRAPGCTGPSGCLTLLVVDGTLKTHRLWRFKQVQRLVPSTPAMLSGTERVHNLKIRLYSHITQPSCAAKNG